MYICIPLAGKGERFYREGFTRAKPMIQILEKPILSHVLDCLGQLGNLPNPKDKVFLFFSYRLHQEDGFVEYFSTRYPWITMVPIPRETSGAVDTVLTGLALVGHLSDEPCLLLDGDTFYTIDIIGRARQHSGNGVFCFRDLESKKPIFSYVRWDIRNIRDTEGGNNDNNDTLQRTITHIREKEKISDYANTGAYLFSSVLELQRSASLMLEQRVSIHGECYTSELIRMMIQEGRDFQALEIYPEEVVFLGTPKQVRDYLDRTFAFLFDLDGTLVNSDGAYLHAWENILGSCTQEFFDLHIKGNSDDTVLRKLMPGITPEQIATYSKQKDDLFISALDKIEAVPGAIEFVRETRRNGHRVVVVTNCNRRAAESILDHFHLTPFVEYLVIGNECTRAKPYPDPYLKALEVVTIESKNAIIFEDSQSGMLAAMGASPRMIVGVGEETRFGASRVVDSFVGLSIYSLTGTSCMENRICDQFLFRSAMVHDNKLKGGFISDTVRVTVTGRDYVKKECVLKLQNEDSRTEMGRMADFLNLYDREYYFYEHLSTQVPVSVPEVVGIVCDSSSKKMGILMENLQRPGFHMNLDLNIQSVDVSLVVLDRMARMHAAFWNTPVVDELQRLDTDTGPFVRARWDRFYRKNIFLTNHEMERFRNLVDKYDETRDHLHRGVLTLCHGDIKSPNIFYEEKGGSFEPWFIDWQYVSHGKGVQDLVFFMMESFHTQNIQRYFSLFQHYYYHKLMEHGVTEYPWRQYEQDFRKAVGYFPLLVAMWFGSCDNEDLIDKDFPVEFIRKYNAFLDKCGIE